MRQPRYLDPSQQDYQFNKEDLDNIKTALIGELYRADDSVAITTYSRTLTKVDDILGATQQED